MEWDGRPGSYDSFLVSRRINEQKFTKQGNHFDPVGTHRNRSWSSSDIERTGWLKKKGGLRYFVLRNSPKPSLQWFREIGGKERGSIEDLSDFQVFTFGPHFSGNTLVFKIVPANTLEESLMLQAATNFEMNEWIKAIKRAKQKFQENFKLGGTTASINLFKLLPKKICQNIVSLMDGDTLYALTFVDKFFQTLIFETSTFKSYKQNLFQWREVFTKGSFEKFKKLSKVGVPSKLRSRVWMIVTEAIVDKGNNPRLFQDLVDTFVPPDIKERIFVDIERTFPDHPLFVTHRGKLMMSNVLEAYSMHFMEIGYVQGLNFIVGVLLTVLSEEDAFWVVFKLIDKYQFRGMFENEFPGLQRQFWVFDQLFKENIPALYTHLNNEGVTSAMFATQWFLTLFSASLNMDVILRIWDLFFIDSWIIIHKVSLAMLKQNKDKFLKMTFEGILTEIHQFRNQFNNPDALIKATLNISISSSQFEKLQKLYEPPK